MAMNMYLKLKIDGSDVAGGSTVSSLERADTIECLAFQDAVATEYEASTGMQTGHRTYGPLKIVKRFDKSTPLLAQALCKNQVVEGELWFFRPSPAGDGTEEKYFIIKIEEARISAIERKVQDTSSAATISLPAVEEVSFVFGKIGWSYEPDGIESEDHWSARGE